MISAIDALALIKKFWYVVPLIGILIYAFVLREQHIADAGTIKAQAQQVQTVTAANAGLTTAINAVKAQRVDNDAIATAVAAKVGNNTVTETKTNTIIEKAVANDPKVAAWADAPLPQTVRDALKAP